MWKKLVDIVYRRDDQVKYRTLSASELHSSIKMKNGSAVLLDVRNPDEFKEEHIPGAVNIALHSPEFLKQIQKLEKNKTYFIYCRSGQRSAMACEILAQHGFEHIYDLRGGTTFYEGELKKD
ncbi:MAG: rhodanese-like domain-containing protein [Bacteroidia bacterium]